ncbi:MAG: thymidine phosphorylase [Trueperaceae bacterium]|nr:thymidine phosphorylase [Trueperaceae bacterium]
MHVQDFIETKRDGRTHSEADLRAFVNGVARGEVPDYQAAAWLMAVHFRGLSDEETAVLTDAMAASGDRLDLSGLAHTVDKHSTGGVGDKTTLVLAPLLAACGATVAKVSGRGLGHTGGTIDKLESIPGYRTSLHDDEFLDQAREVGVVVTGQSGEMAPADKVLYALRDATATVASLPLIAASVMSKKLAGGAASIVLDVKVGRGAFMADAEQGRALGATMRAIGRHAGRNVRVVLSGMEQPLGLTVGNALEVREAIAALDGGGPDDLRELVVILAAEVLAASGLDADPERIAAALDDGSARRRFDRWIEAQGGDLDDPNALALAPDRAEIAAPNDGVLADLDALQVGRAVRLLGGGRTRKDDPVDLGVGVELHAKIGSPVRRGEAVATVVHRDGRGLDEARAVLTGAIRIADHAEALPLVLETLGAGRT